METLKKMSRVATTGVMGLLAIASIPLYLLAVVAGLIWTPIRMGWETGTGTGIGIAIRKP